MGSSSSTGRTRPRALRVRSTDNGVDWRPHRLGERSTAEARDGLVSPRRLVHAGLGTPPPKACHGPLFGLWAVDRQNETHLGRDEESQKRGQKHEELHFCNSANPPEEVCTVGISRNRPGNDFFRSPLSPLLPFLSCVRWRRSPSCPTIAPPATRALFLQSSCFKNGDRFESGHDGCRLLHVEGGYPRLAQLYVFSSSDED